MGWQIIASERSVHVKDWGPPTGNHVGWRGFPYDGVSVFAFEGNLLGENMRTDLKAENSEKVGLANLRFMVGRMLWLKSERPQGAKFVAFRKLSGISGLEIRYPPSEFATIFARLMPGIIKEIGDDVSRKEMRRVAV